MLSYIFSQQRLAIAASTPKAGAKTHAATRAHSTRAGSAVVQRGWQRYSGTALKTPASSPYPPG